MPYKSPVRELAHNYYVNDTVADNNTLSGMHGYSILIEHGKEDLTQSGTLISRLFDNLTTHYCRLCLCALNLRTPKSHILQTKQRISVDLPFK